ncbi:hypothetical protein GON26_13305 [Flavobacterium sp. GA093]|uniref:Uncharacterized protein n=1 Tax=Flavobacterium hydrocarbonoxydans TaxID=2683249 RepID=A0A6I4NLW5_9FLAO|nr:hypothetical protein [Flavobacterium hydrocarbonoxydans]MWB95340.1 hypothetical protein [Flavobacterium hydrocarbonoxydans]
MKLCLKKRVFTILCLSLLFISCSSDLDFNQTDDFKLEPVFVANLVYFDVPAHDFVDDGTEHIVAFDAEDFDVFKDKFFNDNLAKAEFDFEITNTINRAFTVSLLLLNDNDEQLETLDYEVSAYTGSANISKFHEVFEEQRLDLLKQTTKVAFVIHIKAGSPLNENSLGNLKLRSSATVYMEIE